MVLVKREPMAKSIVRSNDSPGQGDSVHSTLSVQQPGVVYDEGAVLTLTAHNVKHRTLVVRILRIYRPFTLSCVMKVEILNDSSETDGLPQRVVLKLFDRRFATKLRNEHKAGTWTSRHEDAYTEFVNRGMASKFISDLQSSDDFEVPDDGWTMAENEAYLSDWCNELFHSEIETYEKLHHLQGRQIPRLFSTVSLSTQPTADTSHRPRESAQLTQINGILIEYIPGPTLTQMPDFVQPQYWQSIVDDTIKTLHLFSDSDVLNEEVKTSNIIASQADDRDGHYKVFMLGFAQCRIRQPDETDAEWYRRKAQYDEEGTIGRTMSKRLRKLGFELRYTPSNRFE